jgi:hypothetical protein
LQHKGDLERYADTLATEMGLVFWTPVRQMKVGLGLAPENNPGNAIDDRARMKEFLKALKED